VRREPIARHGFDEQVALHIVATEFVEKRKLFVLFDDYLGRTVNTAASLCEVATDGQVFAAATALQLPDWIERTRRPALHLRGVRNPIPVVELHPRADLVAAPKGGRPVWSIGAVLDGITRPARLHGSLGSSGEGEHHWSPKHSAIDPACAEASELMMPPGVTPVASANALISWEITARSSG
jgi:hypothetical protein